MKIDYCYYCDEDVEFEVIKREIAKEIKGHKINYVAKIAICKKCGNEMDVPGLDDDNLRKANHEYRKKAGIIAIEEIEELLEKYNIGKKPLSYLLGWSEVTIDRYLRGATPLREYSEKLLNLKDPNFMRALLEENRNRLSPVAAKKVEESLDKIEYEKKKPTDATNVARYFQSKIDEEAGSSVTPLKMQKLLYFAQGWHLALYDVPLFNNKIEAWEHGPVVREIYYNYKDYKYNNIERIDYNPEENFDDDQIRLLDEIYNIYGAFDGKVLERMTHKDETWKKAREGYESDESSSELITVESISSYYKMLSEVLDINDSSDIWKGLRIYPDILPIK